MASRLDWRGLFAAEMLEKKGIHYDGSFFSDDAGNQLVLMDSALNACNSTKEVVQLIESRLGARKFRLKHAEEVRERIVESEDANVEAKAKARAAIRRGQAMVAKNQDKLHQLGGSQYD